MDTAARETTLAEDLRALLTSRRELWLLYLATFFEWLGIFSFLPTLPLWLSGDFGMDDATAGWWAALFSFLLTALVVVVGSAADALGIRRVLIGSFVVAAVTRLGMALSTSTAAALAWLMAFAIAYASISPVVQIAIQRASTARTRAFAFSFWYVSFNLAGALAGPLVIDLVRHRFLGPSGALVRRTVALPLLGERSLSAHAVIMGMGFFFAVAGLLVTLLLRRGFEDRVDPEEPAAPTARPPGFLTAIAEVSRDRFFWRFLVLMLLLSLVRMMFQHMHFTWPKYVLREQGDAFPVGTVWAVNSALVLVLAPVATALTRHRRPFDVLLLGTFVSAASPLVLCLGSAMPFQLLAIAVLTVGEVLWLPRLYEYNVAIAPRGREATYVSLAFLPYAVAKLVVGPTSGFLLEWFCPPTGPRSPRLLWAVIGATTLVGPLGIWLGRRWIARDRSEVEAEAA
jgi:MFS family permease